MTASIDHIPTITERFPVEAAYWRDNCERLADEYPDKWLIINGEQVTGVFDTGDDFAEVEVRDPEAVEGLLCFTCKEPVVVPYIQAVDRA